jgi:hypothetical protein
VLDLSIPNYEKGEASGDRPIRIELGGPGGILWLWLQLGASRVGGCMSIPENGSISVVRRTTAD